MSPALGVVSLAALVTVRSADRVTVATSVSLLLPGLRSSVVDATLAVLERAPPGASAGIATVTVIVNPSPPGKASIGGVCARPS